MKSYFIIGGARSGKSSYAEQIAKEKYDDVTYIATAKVIDKDMEERIRLHRQQRPKHWKTIETYKDFEKLQDNIDFIDSQVILLDCITVLITNLMIDSNINFDKCNIKELKELEEDIHSHIEKLFNLCKKYKKDIIFVSNETGLGIVPAFYMGNYFRDISGRVNRNIVSIVDDVYFMIAGIPVKIKHEGKNINWEKDL